MAENLKRIADHRNNGFTARDAMAEHNKEVSSNIHKSQTTPLPLNNYTQQEILDKGGEVKSIGAKPIRIPWDRFKNLDKDTQAKWLIDFGTRYGSLSSKRLAMIFGAKDSSIQMYMTNHHKNILKQYSPKTNKLFKDDLFEREMLKGMMPLPKDFKPSTPIESGSSTPPAPVVEEKPKIVGALKKALLKCDFKDAPTAIEQLGMSGRVKIIIYSESEGDNNDGLK